MIKSLKSPTDQSRYTLINITTSRERERQSILERYCSREETTIANTQAVAAVDVVVTGSDSDGRRKSSFLMKPEISGLQ